MYFLLEKVDFQPAMLVYRRDRTFQRGIFRGADLVEAMGWDGRMHHYFFAFFFLRGKAKNKEMKFIMYICGDMYFFFF